MRRPSDTGGTPDLTIEHIQQAIETALFGSPIIQEYVERRPGLEIEIQGYVARISVRIHRVLSSDGSAGYKKDILEPIIDNEAIMPEMLYANFQSTLKRIVTETITQLAESEQH